MTKQNPYLSLLFIKLSLLTLIVLGTQLSPVEADISREGAEKVLKPIKKRRASGVKTNTLYGKVMVLIRVGFTTDLVIRI